jgi:hypothetical protein
MYPHLFSSFFALILSSFPLFSQHILLLDTSRTMGQSIEGSSKMQMVQEALRDYMSSKPLHEPLYLFLYGGSSQGGECRDIKRVGSSTKPSASLILHALNQIEPRGNGSVLLGLKESLLNRSSHASLRVTLIASSWDHCYPNPCAWVKRLKSKMKHLRIDVIALGVLPKAHRQLFCIAESSGGSYWRVEDQEGLEGAIKSILDPIKEQEVLIPFFKKEAQPSRVKSQKPHDSYGVEILLSPKIEKLFGHVEGYLYAIDAKGVPLFSQTIEPMVILSTREPLRYRLKKGRYRLSLFYLHHHKEVDFEVEKDRVVHVDFFDTFSQLQMKLRVRGLHDAPIYALLYAVEETKRSGKVVDQLYHIRDTKPRYYHLPLGNYVLQLAYKKRQEEIYFEIKSHQSRLLWVDLDRLFRQKQERVE